MIRNYGLCVDCVLIWFNLIMCNRIGVIFEHEIIRDFVTQIEVQDCKVLQWWLR